MHKKFLYLLTEVPSSGTHCDGILGVPKHVGK